MDYSFIIEGQSNNNNNNTDKMLQNLRNTKYTMGQKVDKKGDSVSHDVDDDYKNDYYIALLRM